MKIEVKRLRMDNAGEKNCCNNDVRARIGKLH
jgi:hypothetical protein